MPHVAVLMGGLSAEREVSLNTAKSVIQALEAKGYTVSPIDVDRGLSTQLQTINPDIVFNALHGTYGEDGCVQGVLEMLHIPYTHSGVMASAIAMHKPMTKKIASSIGIPVAGSRLVSRKDIADHNGRLMDVLKRPYVVKPVDEGSSVGVLIVQEGDEVKVTDEAFPTSEMLMVEEFIPGRELTVAVLDGEAMNVLEIAPKQGFYDYANKYTTGKTEYTVPAAIAEDKAKEVMGYAETIHLALGCRGVTRSDFRLRDDGALFFLEVNTHPGMTATSLVPKIAASVNLSFEDLVERLTQSATTDHA